MIIGSIDRRFTNTWPATLLACLFVSFFSITAQAEAPSHEPVVDELLTLLERRTDLHEAMDAAIETAALQGVDDVRSLAAYLDDLVTWIPTEREIIPKALSLYYIVNQAPEDKLNNDDEFNAWLKDFFASLPNYSVDDYFEGPSGWLTFNQFFAREMRPGKRPIAAPRDDKVIVSPADAVFMGHWPITEDSNITLKGVNWAVADLLDSSPYKDAFKGGIYMHSYLDVRRNPDGSLDVVDGDTYQFNQERGLIVIDSPEVGLVAVLPIGMAYVSSVNLTPEVGAELQKGDEFGFFLFGGSDIVIVFQDNGVVLDADIGRKYLQGQRIGELR
jgi:phosphatidylserine decarboxylase